MRRESLKAVSAALFMLALGGLIVACCSCVERDDGGHRYYRPGDPDLTYYCSPANTQYLIWRNMGIAPLLDIDGNPVKCGESGLERKDWQD